MLAEVAQIAEARGGVLVAANVNISRPRWVATDDMREPATIFVEQGYYRSSVGASRRWVLDHCGFLGDRDIVTQEEIDCDPFYQAVLLPAELDYSAATVMAAPTGDMLMCIVARGRERGPVEPEIIEKLDALRPHLARSALFSARLSLERARAVAGALHQLGLPALVFDFDGRVLAANPLIETERELFRWGARDRLAFVDRLADAMLRRSVKSIADDEASAARSFAVRDANSVALRVAHIVPIRGAARDIFARAAGVLMLTPLAFAKPPTSEMIRSLFDLTPAEARVARALTGGQTLQRFATENRVSVNTVRTHLRAVLEKTGCNRQAEVVALLSGLARPAAFGSMSTEANGPDGDR